MGNELQNSLVSGVDRWYQEVTDPGFNPDSVDKYVFDAGTGHYSQVGFPTSVADPVLAKFGSRAL